MSLRNVGGSVQLAISVTDVTAFAQFVSFPLAGTIPFLLPNQLRDWRLKSRDMKADAVCDERIAGAVPRW
ncbi:hypothetical protein [Streptomyces xanthophaeus]